MIRVDERTIQLAFEAFATRQTQWVKDLKGQVEMYRAAQGAFGGSRSLPDFNTIYNGLKKWRLFRAGKVESAEVIHGKLLVLPKRLRELPLSQLCRGDWTDLKAAFEGLKDIKKIKAGVSLMAISKLLHFWNPRLFVIDDREEIEGFVFGHQWLYKQINGAAKSLWGKDAEEPPFGQYANVLAFASQFIKGNDRILSEFDEALRKWLAPTALPEGIRDYEATAVEWCLIGLAELKPDGVRIE
jgi:hypothetical protein